VKLAAVRGSAREGTPCSTARKKALRALQVDGFVLQSAARFMTNSIVRCAATKGALCPCGRTFRRTTNQRYCSPRCRQRSQQARRHARAAQERAYYKTWHAQNRELHNAKRRVVLAEVPCAACGRVFRQPTRRSRHCSPQCRQRDKQTKRRAANAARASRKARCRECGRDFRTQQAVRIYCTPACYRAAHREQVRARRRRLAPQGRPR